MKLFWNNGINSVADAQVQERERGEGVGERLIGAYETKVVTDTWKWF